jgi:MFS family permease
LGFVSMLADISSELIHSLLPVFMVSVLGASAFAIGVLEGTAEATALIVKVFSGTLSDYLGKRKALTLVGYSVGALTKPLFAIATSVETVFVARVLDRIGKGIRGAPRDALVADIAPPHLRGAAFGLRQSLDTVGAFAGPLLAMVLMLLWANDFRVVFWVAVVPGLLSVIVLAFGVREPEGPRNARRTNPIHWRQLKRFLLLRAQQGGLPLAWVPLVLVAMNFVYASSAYPFGKLSDRMSHRKLLATGLVVLIAADFALAFSNSWRAVFFGVALWGLHMGMTQGLLATMVADAAPTDLRGTAFGFFNVLSGLTMLIASALAGLLWDRLGASSTFEAGALFCVLGLVGIALRAHVTYRSA